MTVGVLKTATANALHDINRLLKQLVHDPTTYTPVPMSTLKKVLADRNAQLIVAREGKQIVGIGLLVIITKFRGRYGYIEDMIVDEAFRGKGIGTKIAHSLIKTAKKQKITTLELSTRPSRESANHLYKKLGFEYKETNVYRKRL